jgi:hypothetical protein
MSNGFENIVNKVQQGVDAVEKVTDPIAHAAREAWERTSLAGMVSSMVHGGIDVDLKNRQLEVHGGLSMPSIWNEFHHHKLGQGAHDEKLGEHLHQK